jgi:hypothetical protein
MWLRCWPRSLVSSFLVYRLKLNLIVGRFEVTAVMIEGPCCVYSRNIYRPPISMEPGQLLQILHSTHSPSIIRAFCVQSKIQDTLRSILAYLGGPTIRRRFMPLNQVHMYVYMQCTNGQGRGRYLQEFPGSPTANSELLVAGLSVRPQ